MIGLYVLLLAMSLNLIQWFTRGMDVIFPFRFVPYGIQRYNYWNDILGYSGQVEGIILGVACLLLSPKYKIQIGIYIILGAIHLLYYLACGGFPFSTVISDNWPHILYDHISIFLFGMVVLWTQYKTLSNGPVK